MARGMWTGIAAGLKDIEDKRRYEREYQDKLNLLNQERQDRLFSMALQFAPTYSASGILTSSGETSSSGGAGTPSASFYEEQLKAYNFSDESILALQEQGPTAMQAAIEVFKENYDPDNPYDESALSKIADSIILDKATISQGIDPVEYAKQMGLNMDLFPEGERNIREAILSSALSKSKKQPAVASTYLKESRVELEDIERFNKILGGSIITVLENKMPTVSVPEQGEIKGAISAIEKGSYKKAFDLLKGTPELKGIAEEVFNYFPPYKNPEVPLGIFEPLQEALKTPSDNVTETATVVPGTEEIENTIKMALQINPNIPKTHIDALRANPSKLRDFIEYYGLDKNPEPVELSENPNPMENFSEYYP